MSTLSNVIKNSFMSIGLGFIGVLLDKSLAAGFLTKFFEENLITILVALLAINATTMGIVLTKIRELTDKINKPSAFAETKAEMLITVKEQVGLIIIGVVLLICNSSLVVSGNAQLALVVETLIAGVFAYGLIILYDTATSVLIIIDFDAQ